MANRTALFKHCISIPAVSKLTKAGSQNWTGLPL
jgi:hypothetical protein